MLATADRPHEMAHFVGEKLTIFIFDYSLRENEIIGKSTSDFWEWVIRTTVHDFCGFP